MLLPCNPNINLLYLQKQSTIFIILVHLLASSYDACMDVTDSDHKPVRCKFQIEIARVDEVIKRQKYGDIIEMNEEVRSLLEDSRVVPETTVNADSIIMQNQEPNILKITNKSTIDNAAFKIICEGQSAVNWDGDLSKLAPKISFGFPFSLEVLKNTNYR